MTGTFLKNELDGKSVFHNVILTATMWDEIDGETGGLKEEEEELKSRLGYW